MQHPHSGIRLTASSRGPTLRIVTEPVVLVHGWGGSFASTWERSGFTALLADAGRDVIGVDLLGHGSAPKPHDPAAYSDLTTRIVEALPDGAVDAVGFSLGALTLLRTAIAAPERFHGCAAGSDATSSNGMRGDGADRAVSRAPGDDNLAAVGSMRRIEGNDALALAAVLRRTDHDTIHHRTGLGKLPRMASRRSDFAQPADALRCAPKTLRGVAKQRPFATMNCRVHRRARLPRRRARVMQGS